MELIFFFSSDLMFLWNRKWSACKSTGTVVNGYAGICYATQLRLQFLDFPLAPLKATQEPQHRSHNCLKQFTFISFQTNGISETKQQRQLFPIYMRISSIQVLSNLILKICIVIKVIRFELQQRSFETDSAFQLGHNYGTTGYQNYQSCVKRDARC